MKIARPNNTVVVKNPLSNNTYRNTTNKTMRNRKEMLTLAKTFKEIRDSIENRIKKEDPKRVAKVIKQTKNFKDAEKILDKYYGRSAAISGPATVKNKRTWFQRMFKRIPKLYKKNSKVMTKRKRNLNMWKKDYRFMNDFIEDSYRLIDMEKKGKDAKIRDELDSMKVMNDARKQYLQKYNNLELV